MLGGAHLEADQKRCPRHLLDLGFLVLDVQRGHDAFGEDAGAGAARRAARDPSIEDQLHLIGAAEVEILTNDFFEETAARHRPVEDLGQREFALEDGQVMAIAGRTVCSGEGMRQAPEPFAKQGVDLGGVQRVGDPLHAAGHLGRTNAVVQRLKGNAALSQLAFEPLVPIETELGRVRKVRGRT